MLSIAKLSHGQERYYLDGAGERVDAASAIGDGVEDYYVDATEAVGRWAGSAAERLGISGDVDGAQLRRVLGGVHPVSGASLRASERPLKVAAFDMTFSAPKSVSVLFGVGDDAMRRAVRDAHDVAAGEALGYLERTAVAVRRGHAGSIVEAADGVVAAVFRHRSSRAGDPQLHSHVVVANLAQGSDGRWTALDGRRLFKRATTASHVYQGVLRAELTRRLGVSWTSVQRGIAEVDGVSPAVRRAFSRRRVDIEAELARRGTAGPRAAEAAALATRSVKRHDVGVDDLHDQWIARAADLGFTADAVLARRAGHQRAPGRPEPLLGAAGLTAQASTFSRSDVVAAMADRTSCPSADDAERAADALLAHPDVIAVAVDPAADGSWFRRRDGRLLRVADDDRRYTTRELLETEQRLLTLVADGRRTRRAQAPIDALDPRLSDEQRRAVQALIGGGDAVAVLAGRAGTGKTFALAAAREAWEAAGHPVRGVAVARRAARELEQSAGIPSTSVTALLARLDARAVRSASSGLPHQCVLVVDEAGMLGTRDLARLAEHVDAAHGKLVLVGDHRQLPEIDAGGVFHALVRRGHAVELRENRRQVHAWERNAIDHLRSGETEQALAMYAAHGRLHLSDGEEETRERLVEAWAGVEGDAVMVAYTRADVADLNARARERRRAAGALGEDEVWIGDQPFAVGDAVVMRRNDGRLGIVNGDRGRVVAVADDGLTVSVGTRQVRVGANFGASGPQEDRCPIQHAYAVTCHVAQGATVDHAFVLADSGICAEWGYTALTRGRHGNHLFRTAAPASERAEYAPLGRAVAPPDPLAQLAAELRRAEGKTLAFDGGRRRAARGRSREAGLGR